MNTKTAILLFSRDPSEDAKLKSSGKIMRLAGNCFEKSLTRILTLISDSRLDYFVSTTKEKGEEYFSKINCPLIIQSQKSFGERFYESMQNVFEKGFDNVIVMGNDTPFLKQSDITFSVKHTSKNNSVLGPSKDGGFYLLSINKNDFNRIDPIKFMSINYQQSNTLAELISLLNEHSIYRYLLKKKDDFDKIYTIQDYILFKGQIEKAITIIQNIIFYNLYLKFIITLFIKYKISFYTFTSLSSPPVLL